MKPASNRGTTTNVVLVMVDGSEEMGMESNEGPMTQRCVYVQDRDSQRWCARALAETVEVEAICGSAE